MGYGPRLRTLWKGQRVQVEDLFLLEAFQIENLRARAPHQGLAAVITAHPELHRFFVTKEPAIAAWLEELRDGYEACDRPDELARRVDDLLWEIADLIFYNKDPVGLDARLKPTPPTLITELVDVQGKVVVDAGAGTGRVAFAMASRAAHVFAVEPVGALRRFMVDKAQRLGRSNLYVTDGFLHRIPMPRDSVDVLATSRAIGWDLDRELEEMARVLRPQGMAIHLSGYPTTEPNPIHEALLAAGYSADPYEEPPGLAWRYRRSY